jgi:putative FmdB family regulatory protein
MPLYEYKCQSCGQISEILILSTNDDAELLCLHCGSNELQKLFSVPSIVTERKRIPGTTCCGRTERCEKPPCSSGGRCRK